MFQSKNNFLTDAAGGTAHVANHEPDVLHLPEDRGLRLPQIRNRRRAGERQRHLHPRPKHHQR